MPKDQIIRAGRGFFNGAYGLYVLPGVVLQSVLIGGGYATGREIVEYGAKFGALGWIAGLGIFFGFALMAVLMLEMARRFQAFDYRSLLRQLIGPFYWLFDIVYILMAILIIAIMASATGEILESTLGLQYWMGVLLIVVLVGLLNFYGEGLIERFKSLGTLLLYIGYILFASLIIAQHWDSIVRTLGSGSHSLYPNVSIRAVVWSGILYVGYNLAVFPAALFTPRRQTRMRQSVVSGILAGVFMTIPWFLTYFALMGFYPREEVFGATVPWLVMLGNQAAWVVVIFGVIVGWTLIETATGMIYALIARLNQNLVDQDKPRMSRSWSGAIAVLILALSVLLARVGIIDLVGKGYTIMAYAMIAVFAVPLLVRGSYLIATRQGHSFSKPGDPAHEGRAVESDAGIAAGTGADRLA